MGLIHQARNQGPHPGGNREMGNCFEQRKLIILEGIEGNEIKVRQKSYK